MVRRPGGGAIRGGHGTATERPRISVTDPPLIGENDSVTAVGVEAISSREAEVLDALGEHLTNAEIARRLHISVRTVESHVSSLLRKLGAADRRDLAAQAAEMIVL